MTHDDIRIGGRYIATVNHKPVEVEVQDYSINDTYGVLNLDTGRELTMGLSRFRHRAKCEVHKNGKVCTRVLATNGEHYAGNAFEPVCRVGHRLGLDNAARADSIVELFERNRLYAETTEQEIENLPTKGGI
jgi:hypothetical protein